MSRRLVIAAALAAVSTNAWAENATAPVAEPPALTAPAAEAPAPEAPADPTPVVEAPAAETVPAAEAAGAASGESADGPPPLAATPPPLPEAPPPLPPQVMFHYAVNGAQQGPTPESALEAKARAGEIGRGTLVWTQGMAAWQAIEDHPSFRDAFAEAAPDWADFVVGTWQSEGFVSGMAARSTISYYPNGAFDGVIEVWQAGLDGMSVAAPVDGSWRTTPIDAGRFTLSVNYTDPNSGFRVDESYMIERRGDDALYNRTEQLEAYRIQ